METKNGIKFGGGGAERRDGVTPLAIPFGLWHHIPTKKICKLIQVLIFQYDIYRYSDIHVLWLLYFNPVGILCGFHLTS